MRLLTCCIATLLLLPAAVSASVTVIDQDGAALQGRPRSNGLLFPYVVITDSQLEGPFTRLAKARTYNGLNATVVTLQGIQADYPSGVDLAERVRLFLRDAYANWGTRWVLLGGDESVVPVRRALLRMGPVLGDIFLPTDQYYACLDGNWNADGDGFWGENPGPGEPGDNVDFVPELFIGRAPVKSVSQALAFVQRTLDYEERLAGTAPRSALLAAEILGSAIDLAFATERLRPALEADPSRSITRLYENSAAWPGSQQESRPALREALSGGFDLVVLHGGGIRGIISAGQDPFDRVTSGDMLGLTNAPHYPIVYVMSAWTTDPGKPVSIGNALLAAPRGGAVAVLGTTDLQFVAIADLFMDRFFDRAIGAAATPIGEALAGAITAMGSPLGDGNRLTTQGMMLLGDPALRIDRPVPGSVRVVAPVASKVQRAEGELAGTTLAMTGGAGEQDRSGAPGKTDSRREAAASATRATFEVPSIARASTTIQFELRGGATEAYAVDIFDASGRRVRALANGPAASRRFELRWDLRSDRGEPVPSGIYFVRLQLAGSAFAQRLVVLR